MAKWGEGDPRWIVEERPDATNVNNWHWTEKNACNWSQQQLKKLLVNLEIEGESIKCVITALEQCVGEAVVNNRKGKLIFLYEWNITGSWQGRLNGTSEAVEGKFNIPNLSEENDISEVEVNFTLNDESVENGSLIKEFLYRNGKNNVREALKKYIMELKEEFPKGLILPKKEDGITSKFTTKSVSPLHSAEKVSMTIQKPTSDTNITANTTTITMSHSFPCTAGHIYNALTVAQVAKYYAGDEVKIDAKKGGHFELFRGNICGIFEELVPEKKIVQKWRLKAWPANYYTTVTITIEQQSDCTLLYLIQTGVPQSEDEGTQLNWNRYYWEPLKRSFGFGNL